MRRSALVSVVLVAVLAGSNVVAAGESRPAAKPKPKPKPVFATLLRSDFVDVLQATVAPAGVDAARDTATGDVFTATGSADVRMQGPRANAPTTSGQATGGGRWVHQHGGVTIERGVYVVTRLGRWTPGGGTFGGATDAVGIASQATGGTLELGIRLVPDGGAPRDATLTVFCALTGTRGSLTEGITLTDGTFNYVQFQGITLFHIRTFRLK